MIAALPAAWLASRLAAGYAASTQRRRLALAAAMAAAFGSAALIVPPNLALIGSLVLAWALVCLACIDLSCFRLPDVLTLPLLLAGLGVAMVLPGAPLVEHLIGAAAGGFSLAALAWVYRRVRGVDGIGLGDAKLLAAAGAWLGWPALPSVVLIACVVTFIWIGAQAIARGRAALSDRLAFGAPLCLAVWIVWLAGPLSS